MKAVSQNPFQEKKKKRLNHCDSYIFALLLNTVFLRNTTTEINSEALNSLCPDISFSIYRQQDTCMVQDFTYI